MNARRILNKLLYEEKWNIGFTAQSVSELVDNKKLNTITWLKEEVEGFSADPFVLHTDTAITIYYEYMDTWRGRGEIYNISNFDFSTKKKVTGISPSNIHLSYPYIFTFNETIYCVPETSEANEVALYVVLKSDPAFLKKQKLLLSGAGYLDSSIIEYNGSFWLFTSIKGENNQFYIFFSDKPDGDYQLHAQNPIQCNKQLVRGAGQLFINNGTLYRPTQNPVPEYGSSIIISKIIRLTKNEFECEFASEILPDQTYNRGTHNICFTDQLIIIDGKKLVFSPLILFTKLYREMRSLQAKFFNTK